MTTKNCIKCGEEFPATREYFRASKSNESGIRGECKGCRDKYMAIYREDKKEAIAKKYKQYCNDNKEVIAEKAKIYKTKIKKHVVEYGKLRYRMNREHEIEISKQYYWDNRDYTLKYAKQYGLDHKERYSEYRKKYREEHLEYFTKYGKAYLKVNKEKFHIYNQKRRARKSQLPATLTVEQWTNTKLHFNNRCAYCGKELPLAQDHFIALSKDGEYTCNNIIPSCKSCNSRKHNADFFTWYPKQKCYSKKREAKILKFLGYNKQKEQQLKMI